LEVLEGNFRQLMHQQEQVLGAHILQEPLQYHQFIAGLMETLEELPLRLLRVVAVVARVALVQHQPPIQVLQVA
jgi:hypothetical protein